MKNADAIVIGGGIAGASVAAELAVDMLVVLVEQETQAGFHATGRSAAVFVPNYGDAAVRSLTRASRTHFDRPDERYWPTPLLSPRGLLRVVRADGLDSYLKQIDGAEGTEKIDVAEAIALFPILRGERFVDASYEADVHDIDVDALLQGYLRKARSNGAMLLYGGMVSRIERSAGLWTVQAGLERLSAPFLVNAAGAWADRIAALAGVRSVGLRSCRRSVAVLPTPERLAVAPTPFTVPFPLDWYAKKDGGALLVSCAEEDHVEPHDAYPEEMALAEGMYRFEQDTTISVSRVERSWAGLRTISPDGLPVIGRDPVHDGFFWTAGQGGFGVQTAPAVAALAAGSILSAARSNDESFSPGRFGGNA